jgi:hypothetical protein
VGDEHGTELSGAIYAMAIKNNKMWFRMNGTWYGDPAANTPSAAEVGIPLITNILDGHKVPAVTCFGGLASYGDIIAVANFGQNGTFNGNKTASGNTDANGIGDFFYSVPSGFLALCSSNLPTPTIAKPTDYFNTVTYSGNNSTRDITIGFQPDLVWTKSRNYTYANLVQDAVRGATNELRLNTADAQNTEAQSITAFTSTGYSLGTMDDYNLNGGTYASWNWKAGGAVSTDNNTVGDIDSTVSVNQDAGFSIVTWVGNGSSTDRVGHGLGTAPKILTYTSTSYGPTWNSSSTVDWYWWFNHNGSERLVGSPSTNGDRAFNVARDGSNINSTTFTNGGWTSSWGIMLVYAWAEKEGFSKIGFYEGNNSADGPFVYTGFRPAWIMIKYIDGDGESWWVQDNKRDPYNVSNHPLFMNLTAVESATGGIDFLSNGFKFRATNGGINANTDTYMYMAFAEYPFKYANAR